MILYHIEHSRIVRREWAHGEEIPADTVWIDLLNVTPLQEKAVEEFLGVEIPTREEMSEIEVSNRLYGERGYLFMTATVLTHFDTAPETQAITFIVSAQRLVTIRYSDLMPFQNYTAQLLRGRAGPKGPEIFLGLLDAITDRAADILEKIDRDIDAITKSIFRPLQAQKVRAAGDYQKILEQIGGSGDGASKLRESMVSFNRLVAFAGQSSCLGADENGLGLNAQVRDIAALSDHATFLSNKVNFLLDATLGMISIEQNAIIKIFSVAAVVFLPPTLIASVYGMNFDHMPELDWGIGYPLALLLMVLSAILPYRYFKRRKWL